MRILITTFTFAPQVNGVAEVVRHHAEGLAALGHEITIATGFDPDRNLASSAFQVEQFNVQGNANPRVGLHGETERYRDFVRRWDGNVIMSHCWQTWSTDLLFDLLPKHRAKKVLISHGFSAHRYPLGVRFPRGLRSWLGWRAYVRDAVARMRSFDRVVFLAPIENHGPYYDHLLAARHGLLNIAVIASGVAVATFRRAGSSGQEIWPANATQNVLWVGTYDALKNPMMALEAFAMTGCRDASLVFIGPSLTDYSMKMKAKAESIEGLRGRVRSIEKLKRATIVEAYCTANVFLCTSRWESGPLVILEAMAGGTAWISTDVGFVRTLSGGFVVKSAEEMAIKLAELLNNPVASRQLGQTGRLACERSFDWPIIISHYDRLLNELAGPP